MGRYIVISYIQKCNIYCIQILNTKEKVIGNRYKNNISTLHLWNNSTFHD